MDYLLELAQPINGVKWEAVGTEIFKNYKHALNGDQPRYTGKGLNLENGKLVLLGEWTTDEVVLIARVTGNVPGCNNTPITRTADNVHFFNGKKRWLVADGVKFKAA